MIIGRNISCYKRVADGNISVLLEHRQRNETLLFEKGVVAELEQSETEEIKKLYAKSFDCYCFIGALKLYIGDETFIFLFFVDGCTSVGKIKEDEIFKITSCSYLALQENSEVNSRVSDLQRFLSSGSFFFSCSPSGYNTFDLSLCAQRRHLQQQPDNRFFWNRALHLHLERFGINCNDWLVRIMSGCVQIRTVYVGTSQAKACLISRLSCERAGTRFNVRGTNDDGHVANFVETEQLILLDDSETSFVQTRGSVPVFWEQPGVQVGSHKIKFSRGYEASSPAFERHIASLKDMYGYQLLVNLLGRKEGEHLLSTAYKDHLKDSSHSFDTHIIMFDYHYHCRGGKTENLQHLVNKAHASIENFGFFVYMNDEIDKSQVGTIRTNCVDCLDRTNAVQTKFAQTVLVHQITSLGLPEKSNFVSRFQEVYKSMWIQNGDQISKLYSGTGALDSGIKGTLGSKFHDGAVSVKRAIVNNFLDGSKQEAIDILLLGNTFIGKIGERARALLNSSFLHSSPKILKELCFKHKDYTKTSEIRVCCGTWNVNGGKHFRSIAYKHMSMHDWLLDFHKKAPEGILDKQEKFERPPDIYALGFEELVDLNANNIISTSSTQKKEWGSELQKVISRDHPYVLVTAEQLVGVCLYVFVRIHHLPFIRDVAVDTVKTGLKGSTGNKGAVAIRLLLHSTSICFVCAHLAAGQSNVRERNDNYHDISKRITFPMIMTIMHRICSLEIKVGSSLSSHDYVFWCGDFNYRIDLPNEECKEMVKEKRWPELRASDQLSVQKAEGKIFRGFREGPINFAPTYKYDLFSDDYDTSDKQRCPAWTDRVLWSRKQYKEKDEITFEGDSDDELEKIETAKSTKVWNPGKILYYGRAELKTSDHRPVIALTEIEVQTVDQKKLVKVHDEQIRSFGPANPTIIVKPDRSGEDLPEDFEVDIESALEVFQQCGEIVLVRAIDDQIFFTYEDGRSALASLELTGKEIDGVPVEVSLKSSETLSKTDPSVHSLLSLESRHSIDESITDEHGFTLSDLLTHSNRLSRSGSLLIPEKLELQDNFMDDDARSVDDALDGDSDSEPEDFQEEDSQEMLRKRQEEMIDSDEEEELAAKAQSKAPSRPVNPPLRPSNPPKRPAAPPKRPTAPAKRPPPPSTGNKTEVARSQVNENVIPEKEIVMKSRARPSFSEFDPLVTKQSEAKAEVKKPERPERPARPKMAPAKPAPPRILKKKEGDSTRDSKDLKDLRDSEDFASKKKEDKKDTYDVSNKADVQNEETISTPFNVTHLLHVDSNNVEEFMNKLSETKSGSLPKPSVLKSRRRASEIPKTSISRPISSSFKKTTDAPEKPIVEPKSAPKAPARPISCIPSLTSDVRPQGSLEPLEDRVDSDSKSSDSNPDIPSEKRAPPRPNRRPVSVVVDDKDTELNSEKPSAMDSHNTADVNPETAIEREPVPPRRVDNKKASSDTKQAPRLPPRRPPRANISDAAGKSASMARNISATRNEVGIENTIVSTDGENDIDGRDNVQGSESLEFGVSGNEVDADDMYASIDDTSRVPVSAKDTNAIPSKKPSRPKPPLPPRNNPTNSSHHTSQTDFSGAVTREETTARSDFDREPAEVTVSERIRPDLPPRHDMIDATGPPDLYDEDKRYPTDQDTIDVSDGYRPVPELPPRDSLSIESSAIDPSDLYSVVTLPRSSKPPQLDPEDGINSDSKDSFEEIPLTGKVRPPLPPRSDALEKKLAPLLPPRTNLE